jgi:transporter family protein
MGDYRWLAYAILSAIAASFVGIFGKLGMNKLDSTLATGIRSIVMTLFLVSVVAAMGLWGKAREVTGWPLVSIILSGVAGAISWLFYFKAIQLGKVSQVAPVDKLSMPFAVILAVLILHEKFAWFNWIGVALVVGGACLASLPAK